MLQIEIEKRLAQFHDPCLDMNWGSAKVLKNIRIEGETVQIEVVLGYPHASLKPALTEAVAAWLAPVTTRKIALQSSCDIAAHAGKPGMAALPGIKNIIAIASGKGGVGKSTVAVNLAVALAKEGAQVGLLDGDIYGPSQPAMLGMTGERPLIKDRKIQPILRHGIQAISIGNLVDANAALAWRGPMLGKALEQLMHDTQWHDLDYLIVDLPPGTGDVQLTLCQKMPVSGAVIVTTPQDLALLDVRRACEMFRKLSVPMLGIVENMSIHRCTQCGHEDNLFGAGGAQKLAAEYQVSVLATIPLDRHIRETTDSGSPPGFFELAHKTAAKLSLQSKNYAAKFPKIVVERKSS